MSTNLNCVIDEPVALMPAPEQVCYEARWQERSVFISAPCQSAREWQWHCLASAILLERLEDACVLAETILETSLQFFVSELPNECKEADEWQSNYLRVLLMCSSDEVEVWLPVGAHNNVVRHGQLIETSNLRWSSVSATIEIANIALNTDDASRLKIGALLLVPASWQPQWLCTVGVPQLESRISATINPTTSTLELDYANLVASVGVEETAEHSVVTACLDQKIPLDPSSILLGKAPASEQSKRSAITLDLAQASCRCRLNEQRFVADLTQVGTGFGLYVREFV